MTRARALAASDALLGQVEQCLGDSQQLTEEVDQLDEQLLG